MSIIPFGWLPGHWGLKGEARDVAKVSYNYTGKERERKLIEINFRHDPDDMATKIANLELRGIELEKRLAEINIKDEIKLNVRKLELDLQYENISKSEFKKQRATLLKEPYIEVIEIEHEPDNPRNCAFEFDWNLHWIELLQKSGYVGETEEDVVNEWLKDIYANVLIEESEELLETNRTIPMRTTRTTIQDKDGDDYTEYS